MKNTMMRLLALLLAMVMVAGVLAGCGGSKTPAENNPAEGDAVTPDEGGEAVSVGHRPEEQVLQVVDVLIFVD